MFHPEVHLNDWSVSWNPDRGVGHRGYENVTLVINDRSNLKAVRILQSKITLDIGCSTKTGKMLQIFENPLNDQLSKTVIYPIICVRA